MTEHSMTEHSMVEHSMAEHSMTVHSMAEHSTGHAQQGRAEPERQGQGIYRTCRLHVSKTLTETQDRLCAGFQFSKYHWSIVMDVVDEIPSARNCPADMPLRGPRGGTTALLNCLSNSIC